MEGVMIKDFPPEAFTMRCLDDTMALLATDDGQERFEGHLKAWMKKIQVGRILKDCRETFLIRPI